MLTRLFENKIIGEGGVSSISQNFGIGGHWEKSVTMKWLSDYFYRLSSKKLRENNRRLFSLVACSIGRKIAPPD